MIILKKKKGIQEWFFDENNYKIYDDFESYPIGNFTSNTKWTITVGTKMFCRIDSFPSGYGKELRMYATVYDYTSSGTSYITSGAAFKPGFSYWIPFYMSSYPAGNQSASGSSSAAFRVNSLTYQTISTAWAYTGGASATTWVYSWILIVQNSSDLWDVWVGGRKMFTNLSSVTSFSFRLDYSCGTGFYRAHGRGEVRIGEVRYF